MRRKRWIVLALLPVLLLVGDFLHWRVAAGHLRAGFDGWAARAQAAGWNVRHGDVTTGGWPDAATLRVDNLTITISDTIGRGGVNVGSLHLGGASLGSDAVVVRIRLARPDVMEITPVGLHPFKFKDGPSVPLSADLLRLRVIFGLSAFPQEVDVDAITFGAALPNRGLVNIGHLNCHADLNPGAGRDEAVVMFSIAAQSVLLPAGMHFALGRELGDLALEGVLNGPWPVGDKDPAELATAWRDAGGSLELHRIAVGWGAGRMDATATLALDEDLQPMGAGSGKIAGYNAALDALSANAMLTRSAAQAAKAVLSLLANTPSDGQPEEVEVPLTLQFRTLSVRQVPLIRFPELEWTGHQSGGAGVLSR